MDVNPAGRKWFELACGGGTTVDTSLLRAGMERLYRSLELVPPVAALILDSPQACVDVSEGARRGEYPFPRDLNVGAEYVDFRQHRSDCFRCRRSQVARRLQARHPQLCRVEEILARRSQSLLLSCAMASDCHEHGVPQIPSSGTPIHLQLALLNRIRCHSRLGRPQDVLSAYGPSLVGLRWHGLWAYFFDVDGRQVQCALHGSIARAGVWECVLFDDVVVVSRPPTVIRFNAQGYLHGETDAAVRFADGERSYFLNGVGVPAMVVRSPERLTAARVLKERDLEVRRLMLDRMDRERFVSEVGAQVVHQDRDLADMPRRLLRVRPRGLTPMMMVEVVCPSTGHRYMLRVPPSMQTCKEAVAWTFGFDDPLQYAPLMEA